MNRYAVLAALVVLVSGLPFICYPFAAHLIIGGPVAVFLSCLPSLVIVCFIAFIIVPLIFQKADALPTQTKLQQARNLPGMQKFVGGDAVSHQRASGALLADEAQMLAAAKAQAESEKIRQAAERKEQGFEALRTNLAEARERARIEKESDFITSLGSSEDASAVRLPENPSAAQVAEALRTRKADIETIIRNAEERLGTLDNVMLKHLPKNTTGSIQAVLQVRRILDALERRLAQIEAFLENNPNRDPRDAQHLVNGPLTIREDSLTTLLDAAPLPPLSPTDWRPTLGALFKRISRRRSLFRGVKFNLSRDKE